MSEELIQDNIYRYKDYHTVIEFNEDDKVYHGKIEGIKDLVSFDGKTMEEAQEAFKESITDYFETCKTVNKKPDGNIHSLYQFDIYVLESKVAERELIIHGLEEGIEEWKQKCADLESQLNKSIKEEKVVCPNCENPYPHLHEDGAATCEDCGHEWKIMI